MRGSSSMITRHAKRLRPDRLDAYAPCDATAAAPCQTTATGARVERSFVPIERMAPALPMTVIASEDGRFCSHRGIDWRELRERLEDVDDISAARAVSTITQQTAKNLFLWSGRSFVRKALEMPLALWIDLVLPKRRVLEIYLNIAEWGP